MLGRWVKEFQEDESEAFRGNGKRAAEGEELRRLREENRQLRMEREILKNPPAGRPASVGAQTRLGIDWRRIREERPSAFWWHRPR